MSKKGKKPDRTGLSSTKADIQRTFENSALHKEITTLVVLLQKQIFWTHTKSGASTKIRRIHTWPEFIYLVGLYRGFSQI